MVPVAQETTANTVRLPYSFSRRFSLVAWCEASLEILHVHPLSLSVLQELQRGLNAPFTLRQIDEAEFEQRLNAVWQRDSSEARQLMEDLGSAEDFFTLAEELPETEDLLESDDDAPIIKLINAMLAEAEENQRMNQIIGRYDQKLKDLGYYSIMGGGSATAFDMLGDTLRGTFGMMPDLIEERDNVKRALEIFVKLHLKDSLEFCRATGSRYAWVMLHKGFDNFISDTDYRELYWPYLQQWILGLIEHDITPVVYTEGAYNTRLKYLKDVPEHKVIYHFEEVDLKLAKKELGDTACLMGGFPVYTVRYGTPEQIEEQVKELLDIMAPGGGYLFTTGYSLEDCPEENMEALLQAVEKYGKY